MTGTQMLKVAEDGLKAIARQELEKAVHHATPIDAARYLMHSSIFTSIKSTHDIIIRIASLFMNERREA